MQHSPKYVVYLLSSNFRDVELPFQWMVYKPQMPRGLPENADAPDGLIISEQEEDRVPELNSVFSVHPSRGFLMPADTMEFFITFAPPVVSVELSGSIADSRFSTMFHHHILQIAIINQFLNHCLNK